MAGTKVNRVIHLALAFFLWVAHIFSGDTGVHGKCDGGFYVDASGTCTSCAIPPRHHSINFNIYCAGLCFSGKWGRNCDQKCGNCVNKSCKRWTGECVYPCVANYHGRRCEISCPNCVSCDGDGNCTCSVGHHGNRCQETCPATCKSKTCTSDGRCDTGCTRGFVGERCETACIRCLYMTDTDYKCEQGWFGPSCNHSCREQCVRDICDRDGRCTEGCTSGLWGRTCETRCPEHCEDSTCDDVTGSCLHDCVPGKSGDKCEEDCASTCAGGCLRDGSCRSCPAGYHGTRCEKRCPNCNTCHKVSGDCLTCPEGYFGHQCQLECKNCLGGCFIDGTCAACRDGWYGDSCSSSCSPGCGYEDAKGCAKLTGYCNGSCKDGWYSFRCDRMCPSGCKYGRCGLDGTCKEGCKMTVYGAYCNHTCSSNCIDSYCDVSEGSKQLTCQTGCHQGRSGLYCQDGQPFLFPVFHVSITFCLVVALILCGLCLRRKMKTIYKQRNRRRLHLSPLTNNTTVSHRPEAETNGNGDMLNGNEPVENASSLTCSDDIPNESITRNDHDDPCGIEEPIARSETDNELY